MVSFFLYYFLLTGMGLYGGITNSNYSTLIVSIFILIIGIVVALKNLFNIDIFRNLKEIGNSSISEEFTAFILLIGAFIIGCLLLYFGIKNTNDLNEKTKDYVETNGYFSSYSIYSESEDGGVTYRLTYTYEVDGKEYSVSTNYGTGSIPDEGSIRVVKYDENNPDEAVLEGMNGDRFLTYLGAFFVIISIGMTLAYFNQMGVLAEIGNKILQCYMGAMFFLVGLGITQVASGGKSSFIESLKLLGLFSIIPIGFIIVGLYLLFTLINDSIRNKNSI